MDFFPTYFFLFISYLSLHTKLSEKQLKTISVSQFLMVYLNLLQAFSNVFTLELVTQFCVLMTVPLVERSAS